MSIRRDKLWRALRTKTEGMTELALNEVDFHDDLARCEQVKKRAFNQLYFGGAGDYQGIYQGDILHARLQRGLSELGGVQQPCHCQSADCPCDPEKEQAEARELCEGIVRDIAAALLGREVTFGDELPYPSKEPLEDGLDISKLVEEYEEVLNKKWRW